MPTPSRSQHPGGLPPMAVMSLALAVGLAVAGIVLAISLYQPWLGLSLKPTNDGRVIVGASTGPAAAIPRGTEITAISGHGDTVEIQALDLTVEPDGTMGDYETYRDFLSRQDRMAKMISAGEIQLTTAEGELIPLLPQKKGRPFSSLPPDFWVQVAVGLVAWLVAATVFAFRPGDWAARYLLLSGAATLTFSPGAAIYSTRELALNGTLFRWASDLNFLGGSLFAASFVALLLHYPRRLGPVWAGIAVVALYIGWFIAQQVGLFESMTFARRFLVMIGVGVTFVLAGVHWVRTQRNPVERAALQWFLLSWMLGTSLFCTFILLPQLFGVDTSRLQGYSFLLFLLVYGGLAFGILRYRLFELGVWWRRIAVWTLTVLLLVLLDMLFLFGLKMSPGMSLSLTLLICGVVWLPLRMWIWDRFRGQRNETHPATWFGRVMDIALAPSAEQRDKRWRDLLNETFSPLGIEESATTAQQPQIGDEGLSMIIPPVGALFSFQLRFPAEGRRLFSPQDVAFAGELIKALDHAFASRSAYEAGVAEERTRIARDIHDNIGGQLLAALHSHDTERKDARIRDSLEDLRSVINDTPAEIQTLDETLAELRLESAEHLAAVGIDLCWEGDDSSHEMLDASTVHALRSIIREAISNIIRHSGARQASVRVKCEDHTIKVEVEDNGKGGCHLKKGDGKGLANMQTRLARLGGALQIVQPERGTRLAFHFPLAD